MVLSTLGLYLKEQQSEATLCKSCCTVDAENTSSTAILAEPCHSWKVFVD